MRTVRDARPVGPSLVNQFSVPRASVTVQTIGPLRIGLSFQQCQGGGVVVDHPKFRLPPGAEHPFAAQVGVDVLVRHCPATHPLARQCTVAGDLVASAAKADCFACVLRSRGSPLTLGCAAGVFASRTSRSRRSPDLLRDIKQGPRVSRGQMSRWTSSSS